MVHFSYFIWPWFLFMEGFPFFIYSLLWWSIGYYGRLLALMDRQGNLLAFMDSFLIYISWVFAKLESFKATLVSVNNLNPC